MAIFDYLTNLYTRIVTALKADGDFMYTGPNAPAAGMSQVWSKNFLDFSDPTQANSGLPLLFLPLWGSGDANTRFPRAILHQGDVADGAYLAPVSKGGTPTFASYETNGAPNWIEPGTVLFRLEYFFRTPNVAINNPIKLAAVRAIKSLGPNMDVTYQGQKYAEIATLATTRERIIQPPIGENGLPATPGIVRSTCETRILVRLAFDGPAMKTLLP